MEWAVQNNLKNRGFDTKGKTAQQILQAMADILGMGKGKKQKIIAENLATHQY